MTIQKRAYVMAQDSNDPYGQIPETAPLVDQPPESIPTHPADLFGCRGREFGSPSRGVLGISDNEGVQWHAGYRPGDGFVWLGVNLKGIRYDDWPVARLIEREISRPLLLDPLPAEGSQDPMKSRVQWTRDAWQYSARPVGQDWKRRAKCTSLPPFRVRDRRG